MDKIKMDAIALVWIAQCHGLSDPKNLYMPGFKAFNSLTGIIIFENSWKNMDTMDRIP